MERISLRNLMMLSIGGGGDENDSFYENYATNVEFQDVDFTTAGISEVEINSHSSAFKMNNSFKNAKIAKVVINANNLAALHYAFLGCNQLTECELNSDTGYVTGEFQSAFANCYALKKITGSPLDATNSSNTNMFYSASALEEVRFKPDTIKNSIDMSGSSLLTNNTLMSVANGLNSSVTGKTLKLHATPKATCATIMGTNNSGTFEADAQGSLSLSDFITTVKGWTLS